MGFDSKPVQRSASCRSRRELSNKYILAKFGFDTSENEPSKVCPLSVSLSFIRSRDHAVLLNQPLPRTGPPRIRERIQQRQWCTVRRVKLQVRFARWLLASGKNKAKRIQFFSSPNDDNLGFWSQSHFFTSAVINVRKSGKSGGGLAKICTHFFDTRAVAFGASHAGRM